MKSIEVARELARSAEARLADAENPELKKDDQLAAVYAAADHFTNAGQELYAAARSMTAARIQELQQALPMHVAEPPALFNAEHGTIVIDLAQGTVHPYGDAMEAMQRVESGE